VVSTTPRSLTPGKDPVLIVQEAGWTPGPVWTCAKNLVPTGIRSPDGPARSQSLYRLSYPAHSHCSTFCLMCDVPSIAVFSSESIECFSGTVSKFIIIIIIITIIVNM
jgi:hypothetical protein